MFNDLLKYLKKNLPKKIESKDYSNYETFGKEIEKPLSYIIKNYLNKMKITYEAKPAKNKNAFPDLMLTINKNNYAFEYKAGISHTNPENDMGTLNAYKDKISKFGDNIYCIFIKYEINPVTEKIQIDDIYFDKIYRFIGNSSKNKNMLKHRKKDGNLRPKSWKDFSNNKVYFKSLNDFERAMKVTQIYRSEQIIYEHLKKLDKPTLKRVRQKLENY